MGFTAKFLVEGLPLQALEVWKPLKNAPETPLQLQQIALILLGLLIGLLVGTLVFLVERGIQYVKKDALAGF